MSPYYPSFYLNDMVRSWELKVLDGQRIKLDILFLNLEINREGGGDFLKIQDGTLFNRDVAVYSGTILPPQFVSETNILVVKFQSDKKNVHTGFKIRYEAIDGKNYQGNNFNLTFSRRQHRIQNIIGLTSDVFQILEVGKRHENQMGVTTGHET